MDPAFALAYSYAQIYRQSSSSPQTSDDEATRQAAAAAAEDEEVSVTTSITIGSNVQDTPAAAAQDAAIWTTDTWTADDCAAAAALLAAHAARCQLPARLRQRLPTDTAAWDRFYTQHQTSFFKDRHYLANAFPHEFAVGSTGTAVLAPRTLVELGCGVGNTLLPLLEDERYATWTIYGLDLSAVAIDLLQQDARYTAAAVDKRTWVGVANLVSDPLPALCRNVAHVATLLFCLSAVAPAQHQAAAAHAAQALRPGGVLVVRDYGRYDQAQLQLATQRAKWLGGDHNLKGDSNAHFYCKADATKCYYFTTEDLLRLFADDLGLQVLECDYIQRQYQNRGQGLRRRRVWVQARFRKPFGR
jgi:SAM-dependent methyltransferase